MKSFNFDPNQPCSIGLGCSDRIDTNTPMGDWILREVFDLMWEDFVKYVPQEYRGQINYAYQNGYSSPMDPLGQKSYAVCWYLKLNRKRFIPVLWYPEKLDWTDAERIKYEFDGIEWEIQLDEYGHMI